MDSTKKVYICSIDWEHELGEVTDHTKVYSSVEDLKRQHTCWKSCGITEVEVRFVREVEPQRLGEKLEQDGPLGRD